MQEYVYHTTKESTVDMVCSKQVELQVSRKHAENTESFQHAHSAATQHCLVGQNYSHSRMGHKKCKGCLKKFLLKTEHSEASNISANNLAASFDVEGSDSCIFGSA